MKKDFLVVAYDCIVRLFLVFIPWAPFFAVFFTYKISIPGAPLFKEILLFFLLLLVAILGYKSWKKTRRFPFHFTWIDGMIFAYVLVLTIITVFTTGIPGIIYGGRYDFIFLLIFLIAYHGFQFLPRPLSYYVRLFLISAGIMLFLSGMLKFPFSEDILFHFGYLGDPSQWHFGSPPPAFHGIAGANVRRFQGLLDGPNVMGGFLLVFMGLFLYHIRYKKSWHFFGGIVIVLLVVMLTYTYSRSALVGLGVFAGVVLLTFMRILFLKFRKEMFTVGIIAFLLLGMLFIRYAGTADAIIARDGSTKGHFERMKIGIERFQQAPFGQGLGSSGPAYRHIGNIDKITRDEAEERDNFYIPESWYIQQLVEGGFLGALLFIMIMGGIFFGLMNISPLVGGAFSGILTMAFFLHILESSVIVYPLFLFLGFFLAYGKKYIKKS